MLTSPNLRILENGWIGGSIMYGVQFVSFHNFQYFTSHRSHAQQGRWKQIRFHKTGLDFKPLSITFDFGLSCLLEGLANESFTIDHHICKLLSTSSCIVDFVQIMCCLCKTCKRLWNYVCLWIYLDCNTVIYFCCACEACHLQPPGWSRPDIRGTSYIRWSRFKQEETAIGQKPT